MEALQLVARFMDGMSAVGTLHPAFMERAMRRPATGSDAVALMREQLGLEVVQPALGGYCPTRLDRAEARIGRAFMESLAGWGADDEFLVKLDADCLNYVLLMGYLRQRLDAAGWLMSLPQPVSEIMPLADMPCDSMGWVDLLSLGLRGENGCLNANPQTSVHPRQEVPVRSGASVKLAAGVCAPIFRSFTGQFWTIEADYGTRSGSASFWDGELRINLHEEMCMERLAYFLTRLPGSLEVPLESSADKYQTVWVGESACRAGHYVVQLDLTTGRGAVAADERSCRQVLGTSPLWVRRTTKHPYVRDYMVLTRPPSELSQWRSTVEAAMGPQLLGLLDEVARGEKQPGDYRLEKFDPEYLDCTK